MKHLFEVVFLLKYMLEIRFVDASDSENKFLSDLLLMSNRSH